jgi:hypothetical protein
MIKKVLVFWAVPCVYGLRFAKYVLLFSEQFRYRNKKAEFYADFESAEKLQKISTEKTSWPKSFALSSKKYIILA